MGGGRHHPGPESGWDGDVEESGALVDLTKNAPLLETCLAVAQLPKEEQAKAVEALRKTAGKKKSGTK